MLPAVCSYMVSCPCSIKAMGVYWEGKYCFEIVILKVKVYAKFTMQCMGITHIITGIAMLAWTELEKLLALKYNLEG